MSSGIGANKKIRFSHFRADKDIFTFRSNSKEILSDKVPSQLGGWSAGPWKFLWSGQISDTIRG